MDIMETSTARNTNTPSFSTAYYFLEGLNELGVEYLFCNFGTDRGDGASPETRRAVARDPALPA
jgi:hypothetical protein